VNRPRLLSFELAWAHAALGAVFPEPPRTVLSHGIVRPNAARFLDELVAKAPLEQALGIRLALWMVALAPLFTVRKLATIATLEHDDRTRVFERLLASPVYVVRQLALSLKALAALLYARSPAVRARMTERVGGEGAAIVPLRRRKAPRGLPATTEGAHEHAAE
jgi:hypothetical protein